MTGGLLVLAGVGVLLVLVAGWARRGRADDGVPARLLARMAREAVSVRRRRQTAAGALTAALLASSGLLRALAVAARVADLALERAAAEVDEHDEIDAMGMPGRLRRWRHSDECRALGDPYDEGDL